VRFKCGPSIWQRLEQRHRRQYEWHSWFAWRPVRMQLMNGKTCCVWWEWIVRKNTGPACLDGWDEWEYRP
jgi:hypothetical protein